MNASLCLCLSVCLSVCLFVCLSVCRSVCLSVCLSLYIHMVSLQISQLFLQIPSRDVFWEKHLSAIVNIFRKNSLINHKCWICLLIFTFMSTSEASHSKWTEFMYFYLLEFLFFCMAEVWHILQGTADRNLSEVSFHIFWHI